MEWREVESYDEQQNNYCLAKHNLYRGMQAGFYMSGRTILVVYSLESTAKVGSHALRLHDYGTPISKQPRLTQS